MSKRIYITGLGIISAIGNDVDQTLDSLLQSKTGVGKISVLKTALSETHPGAEVKKTNDELRVISNLPDNNFYSRTTLLGMIAARQAMSSAKFENVKTLRTGFISATSVGGMDRTEIFYEKFSKDNSHGHLHDVITHDCGESTEAIAMNLGISDYVDTISTACSSSANAIMLGAKLIKHSILDRVIAGGTDALSRFTLNGFNSLMILDRQPCQPFDENRRGLNMGEGAGYIVLESEKNPGLDSKEIFGELTGYANTNDAYHQTASSPDAKGAIMAMTQAMEMARISPGEVDYINAHGTGTPNNDLTEETAFNTIFGEHIPQFSSTKGFTGHTLAAAGGIEAVISLLAINKGIIFPNLRYETKMKEFNFGPVTSIKKEVRIENVLSNSFGFGGNNSSLLFSKV
ncbi:beta-ketoacyl-[acyl-carrier-protein] synthase family protein [soil metagenome]